MSDDHTIRVMSPGQFEPEDHYYPRVPNALLHPLVKAVFRLGNERRALRRREQPRADDEADGGGPCTLRSNVLTRTTRYPIASDTKALDPEISSSASAS